MHTFELNPLVIKNHHCVKTEYGTLVENGIKELDAIVLCFKELLPEAINFRNGSKHKINLITSVELVDGEVIINGYFETLEDLGEDAKENFEISELLNHLLHSTQKKIFEPLEKRKYEHVQAGLKDNVFGASIKKIISQVNASKDVLAAAGVLNVKGKEIDLDKFVDFDYEVDPDGEKIISHAYVDIINVDIIEKNAFTFRLLGKKEKFSMSASPEHIVKIAEWIADEENKDKEFYADIKFDYLFHLKDTFCKCNLISMKLETKRDRGVQLDAFEKEKQEAIEAKIKEDIRKALGKKSKS